jgi:hypothetical protein
MRIKTIQMLFTVIFLAFATQVTVADITYTPYYTNATVVANSRQIIEAIASGDTNRIAGAKALIGSQVAYYGVADFVGGGTNINIYQFISKDSNHVDDHLHMRLYVELKPWHDFRTHGAFSFVEVLGTLESVDFEKRIIYIQAKPENYREFFTL